MSAASTVPSSDTVTCYRYTLHAGNPIFRSSMTFIPEIFIPPPYSVCTNEQGTFFSEKARNFKTIIGDDRDELIELPLEEIQISVEIAQKAKAVAEKYRDFQAAKESLNSETEDLLKGKI